MHRKLERDSASFANAFADAVGEDQVMAVAGRQVAAGLRDADDRLAAAQLGKGKAEVQVAFQVERGHVDIVGVVEPGAAAERRLAPGTSRPRPRLRAAMSPLPVVTGASAPVIIWPPPTPH